MPISAQRAKSTKIISTDKPMPATGASSKNTSTCNKAMSVTADQLAQRYTQTRHWGYQHALQKASAAIFDEGDGGKDRREEQEHQHDARIEKLSVAQLAAPADEAVGKTRAHEKTTASAAAPSSPKAAKAGEKSAALRAEPKSTRRSSGVSLLEVSAGIAHEHIVERRRGQRQRADLGAEALEYLVEADVAVERDAQVLIDD